jgi:hypothetical protein
MVSEIANVVGDVTSVQNRGNIASYLNALSLLLFKFALKYATRITQVGGIKIK